MTIPFAPTPTAADTEAADAEFSYGDTATVTDSNFDLINLNVPKLAPVVAYSIQAAQPDYGPRNVWTDFAANAWAPVTFTVPARCRTVMIGIGGWLVAMGGNAPEAYIDITAKISGNGTSYTLSNTNEMIIGAQACGLHASRQLVIPRSALTPGGTITITPRYIVGPAAMTVMFIESGTLWALATC